MLNVPEEAVCCFEKWSGLRVTVYEKEPIFFMSGPERFIHCSNSCSHVKSICLKRCVDFDFFRYRNECWNYPDGCLKLCHAGLLEWIAPVSFQGKTIAQLVAGVRKAPVREELPAEIPLFEETSPKMRVVLAEPEASQQEIRHFMEGMRQLSARLSLWFGTLSDSKSRNELLTRKEQILFLIKRDSSRNITLDTLSRQLHLSTSRTAHLVQELTGENFKTLVNRSRLALAASLLKFSGETISDIAERCGYENLSHFHRAFKAEFGTTPLKFRRHAG